MVVILAVDAVVGDPGEATFNDPPAWQHDELFQRVGALDHFDCPAEHVVHPRDQLARIGAVHPDMLEQIELMGEAGDEHHGAVAVLDARGMDDDAEQ